MAQMINTNILSLNAQRQLNKSQITQNQAMERLSSGVRINSAKDDAAGLAIATGMQSQIKGINQAVRNSNDGISLTQTAEGAMDEMTNILQRMRELSVQSANDTNSSSNRVSIQKEIDQLHEELDRIASVTQFNGINILDGSGGSTTLQIGANSGETVSFSIDPVTTSALGLNAVSGLGDLNSGRVSGTPPLEGEVSVNGIDIDEPESGSAGDIAKVINDKQGLTGVNATAYNAVKGKAGIDGRTDGALTIDIDNTGPITIGVTASPQELINTINRDVGGVTASLDSDGKLLLSNDTGKSIAITGGAQVGLNDDTSEGYVSLVSSDGQPVKVGMGSAETATAAKVQDIGFNVSSGSDVVKGGDVGEKAITANDGIEINGIALGSVKGTSAGAKAFAINALSSQTGVSASAETQVEYSVNVGSMAAEGVSGFSINGATVDMTGVTSVDKIVSNINASGIQGVVASTDSETGKLVLTSQAGSDIAVDTVGSSVFGVDAINVAASDAPTTAPATGATAADGATDTATTADATGATDTAAAPKTAAAGATDTSGINYIDTSNGVITRGEITLTGENGRDVTIISKATSQSAQEAAFDKLGLTDTGGNNGAVGKGLSVSTAENASNSIDRIDEALNKITDSRSNLGAIQNRLGSTISNLENVSQNLSAAKSRIYDADYAVETSKMSKAQILQQAGTSMLSQANASTQNVLSLLQN